VLHTLEASFWCFLKSMNYAEAVQKAVNLGEDTDTTGCVTGGLAGIYYGIESIPAHWVEALARKNDIFLLAEKLFKATQR
jgi:ADP-ribosyl-[dinitrogen reductase] hydrolase